MAKKKIDKKSLIPKLSYGEGTIGLMPDEKTFIYKKMINGKRVSVYGDTITEVMKLMDEKERNKSKKQAEIVTITLTEAMLDWCDNFKKPKLKTTSYDTLRKTISSRIDGHDIGSTRLSCIDSEMIQKHINYLNDEFHLSYSTIKKCYDALHDFYQHLWLQRKIEFNPVNAVEMINKENIYKKTKTIEFFEKDDIEKFINQATKILNWSKLPQYQYGFCLCANIYLGMRAGELIALKWKNVDFETNTIYVSENLQLVSNKEYDYSNEMEMKLSGITKQVYELQSLKNYQNRHIHINKKAMELLLLQKKYSKFTGPDDYVCCTRDGKHSAISYLSSNISEIEKSANTNVQSHGTHIIRHTCASLYFKAGVRIELIAALLGHSVEVCRSTYVHFVEDQKKQAAALINDFDIEF